jgi:VanZ family protein
LNAFRYTSLILAVLWTAFIVYGLLSEPSGIPRFPWLAKPGVDKVIHTILFGVEASLLVFTFPNISGKLVVFSTLIWCFLLGAFLEAVQYYWVSGRTGDVFDLLADMVGAMIGVGVIKLIMKK